jgi:hypothetical protein
LCIPLLQLQLQKHFQHYERKICNLKMCEVKINVIRKKLQTFTEI